MCSSSAVLQGKIEEKDHVLLITLLLADANGPDRRRGFFFLFLPADHRRSKPNLNGGSLQYEGSWILKKGEVYLSPFYAVCNHYLNGRPSQLRSQYQ